MFHFDVYLRTGVSAMLWALCFTLSCFFSGFLSAESSVEGSIEGSAESSKANEGLFARVDEIDISKQEFDQIYAGAVRHKFYHGKVPEDDLEKFRKQVAKDVVEQTILLREAKKIGIEPDAEAINKEIGDYKTRTNANGLNPEQWAMLEKGLFDQQERRDLLLKLENKVKDLPAPTDEQAKQFYLAHPEKFTQPSRDHVSILLLAVSPSAGGEAWKAAKDKAESLIDMISQGADFAELAKIESADPSAAAGGDLGYLHDGRLSEDAEKALKEVKVGQLTPPVNLLEGVALFKLNDRTAPELRKFEDVIERARGLLLRESQDNAWAQYVKGLKSKATIKVFDDTLVEAVLN